MLHLFMLVALQQPAPAAPPGATPVPPAAPTATQPTTEPAAVYDQGPLRSDILAMFDARYWYLDKNPGARESELRLQMRFAGAGIENTVKVGNIIFTEAVDDTGRTLITPQTYTEEQKTEMRPYNYPPERLKSSGLPLGARIDSPARAAKTIRLRGSLRLVLAPEKVEVAIDNPLQYVGKVIPNDQLKGMGLEIRVVPAEEMTEEDAQPNQIVLQLVKGADKVQEVAFYDAWMKQMRPRERTLKTKGGDSVKAYSMTSGTLDENTQMVLRVFPKIEEVSIPIDLNSVPLP
jgi:hypothetical protein